MPIYVVGHQPVTGPVKIGYSAQPEKRLAQLRNGECCPWDVFQKFGPGRTSAELEILHLVDGTVQLEHTLHRLLVEARVAGEWFSLGDTPQAVRARVIYQVERVAAVARASGQAPAPLTPPKPRAVRPVQSAPDPVVSHLILRPGCTRCSRPRWLRSTMCKAHDLDDWLRHAA